MRTCRVFAIEFQHAAVGGAGAGATWDPFHETFGAMAAGWFFCLRHSGCAWDRGTLDPKPCGNDAFVTY